MSTHALALVLWQLALGFSLAATTGLRAFLPLFATAVAARLGQVQLGASFGWMASDPALVVFGSAVVFEIAADKVPALDHALDAAGVFVKPTAATLLAASTFTSMDPVMAASLGIVAGGATAGGVHLVKAKARLVSSAFTAGVANPLVSLVEDVIAAAGIALAFLVPVLAAVLVACTIALSGYRVVRRLTASPKLLTSPARLATK